MHNIVHGSKPHRFFGHKLSFWIPAYGYKAQTHFTCIILTGSASPATLNHDQMSALKPTEVISELSFVVNKYTATDYIKKNVENTPLEHFHTHSCK